MNNKEVVNDEYMLSVESIKSQVEELVSVLYDNKVVVSIKESLNTDTKLVCVNIDVDGCDYGAGIEIARGDINWEFSYLDRQHCVLTLNAFIKNTHGVIKK